MSWLDNVVAWISPEAGAKRAAWRATYNELRNYDAGNNSTKAWIDNGRGMATIEFDSDEASEVIYQKVKGGTLKGVSVGYLVDNWEEVMPNKTSTDGRFMGPCSIAKKWAPYEISIVSVPADPTVGVGREMEEKSEPGTQDIPLDIYERQLQINKNRMEVKENDD